LTIFANIAALFFQFDYHELPCPLCLLQRFGFLAIGLGAFLNISRGNSWKYDLIIVISSIYTLLVGMRQVFLHILPNDLGYGDPFFGLHFYTWSVIISFIFIILIAIAPFINISLGCFKIEIKNNVFLSKIFKAILMIIILINIVSTYLECGFTQCADNPTYYIKLQRNPS
jgi:disulfide bond formation protein DsbB